MVVAHGLHTLRNLLVEVCLSRIRLNLC
jgi:hypothetical protein